MVGLIGLLLSSLLFSLVHNIYCSPPWYCPSLRLDQARPPLSRSRSVDGQGWSDAKDGRFGAEERASVLRDPPNDRFCLLSLGAHVKKGRAAKVFPFACFLAWKVCSAVCNLSVRVSFAPKRRFRSVTRGEGRAPPYSTCTILHRPQWSKKALQSWATSQHITE